MAARCRRRSPRRTGSRWRVSRPRCSTSARSGRSTPRPSWLRSRRPTGWSSWTRAGARAASQPRGAPGSWRAASAPPPPPPPGSAAPRCRCRTRSTSRTPPCPRPRRSSRPCAGCSAAVAEFVMPILGADMTAGTLIAWRGRPGAGVQRGDTIAEVETDKGLIDVEVFVGGVVEKILVEPGATVPTGTVLALIREEAGAAVPAAPPGDGAPAPGRPLRQGGGARAARGARAEHRVAGRRGRSERGRARRRRRHAAPGRARRAGAPRRRPRAPPRPPPRPRGGPPAAAAGPPGPRDETRATVLRVLGAIAPEADLAALRDDVDLREQLDLDSMDVLNFVVGLHAAPGGGVPAAGDPP